MATWIFIGLGVICVVCMLGAPFFIRWQSRQDRRMHLAYPRIYYVCGVVLCESFFALALLGLGPFALEVDLNRDMPPLPPLVTQMPLIVGIFFTVLAFVSLGIVGTIGIRMSLQRSRERSSGSRS